VHSKVVLLTGPFGVGKSSAELHQSRSPTERSLIRNCWGPTLVGHAAPNAGYQDLLLWRQAVVAAICEEGALTPSP
jgi:hypothetical protein